MNKLEFTRKFNQDIPELYCSYTQTTLKFFRKYAVGIKPERWRHFYGCNFYVSYDKVFLIQLKKLTEDNYSDYVAQIRKEVVNVNLDEYDANCKKIEEYLSKEGLYIDFDNAKSIKVYCKCPNEFIYDGELACNKFDRNCWMTAADRLKVKYTKLLEDLMTGKMIDQICQKDYQHKDRIIDVLREVLADEHFFKNIRHTKDLGFSHLWMSSRIGQTRLGYGVGICSKMQDVVKVLTDENTLSKVVKQYIDGVKVIEVA